VEKADVRAPANAGTRAINLFSTWYPKLEYASLTTIE
jgi:hypothetical protein